MAKGATTGDGAVPVTIEIVRQIAEREGRDVSALPALYEVIDPEALDALVASSDARIEFTYCGYDVVAENETVTIHGEPNAR